MLKELDIKVPASIKNKHPSDGLMMFIQKKIGKKIMKDTESKGEFQIRNEKQRTFGEADDYIAPNGYLPQKLLSRRFAKINRHYKDIFKVEAAAPSKRRVIDPRLERAIEQQYFEVYRRREPLLENEKQQLENLKNRVGFYGDKMTALPMDNTTLDQMFEMVQKQEMLQKMLGTIDPFTITGIQALNDYNARRGNGRLRNQRNLRRAMRDFNDRNNGGGGDGGDGGGGNDQPPGGDGGGGGNNQQPPEEPDEDLDPDEQTYENLGIRDPYADGKNIFGAQTGANDALNMLARQKVNQLVDIPAVYLPPRIQNVVVNNDQQEIKRKNFENQLIIENMQRQQANQVQIYLPRMIQNQQVQPAQPQKINQSRAQSSVVANRQSRYNKFQEEEKSVGPVDIQQQRNQSESKFDKAVNFLKERGKQFAQKLGFGNDQQQEQMRQLQDPIVDANQNAQLNITNVNRGAMKNSNKNVEKSQQVINNAAEFSQILSQGLTANVNQLGDAMFNYIPLMGNQSDAANQNAQQIQQQQNMQLQADSQNNAMGGSSGGVNLPSDWEDFAQQQQNQFAIEAGAPNNAVQIQSQSLQGQQLLAQNQLNELQDQINSRFEERTMENYKIQLNFYNNFDMLSKDPERYSKIERQFKNDFNEYRTKINKNFITFTNIFSLITDEQAIKNFAEKGRDYLLDWNNNLSDSERLFIQSTDVGRRFLTYAYQYLHDVTSSLYEADINIIMPTLEKTWGTADQLNDPQYIKEFNQKREKSMMYLESLYEKLSKIEQSRAKNIVSFAGEFASLAPQFQANTESVMKDTRLRNANFKDFVQGVTDQIDIQNGNILDTIVGEYNHITGLGAQELLNQNAFQQFVRYSAMPGNRFNLRAAPFNYLAQADEYAKSDMLKIKELESQMNKQQPLMRMEQEEEKVPQVIKSQNTESSRQEASGAPVFMGSASRSEISSNPNDGTLTRVAKRGRKNASKYNTIIVAGINSSQEFGKFADIVNQAISSDDDSETEKKVTDAIDALIKTDTNNTYAEYAKSLKRLRHAISATADTKVQYDELMADVNKSKNLGQIRNQNEFKYAMAVAAETVLLQSKLIGPGNSQFATLAKKFMAFLNTAQRLQFDTLTQAQIDEVDKFTKTRAWNLVSQEIAAISPNATNDQLVKIGQKVAKKMKSQYNFFQGLLQNFEGLGLYQTQLANSIVDEVKRLGIEVKMPKANNTIPIASQIVNSAKTFEEAKKKVFKENK